MAIKPPDFDEREARCRELGLHLKFPKQLVMLRRMMTAKIRRLRDELEDVRNLFADVVAIRETLAQYLSGQALNDCMEAVRQRHIPEHLRDMRVKWQRIIGRRAVVADEIFFRQEGWVEREPVGTVYYIDFNAGDDSKDGLTTGNAWKTIEKFTALTSRSPGDIAKIRANTTEIPAGHVVFNDDGAMDNPITLRGCDSVDDPWGDASDVPPKIDFDGEARYIELAADEYWTLINLAICNSTQGTQMIHAYLAHGLVLERCVVYDSLNNVGLDPTYTSVRCTDCSFYNCKYSCIGGLANYVEITNCDFDGGAGGNRGHAINGSGRYVVKDSRFGQTTPFDWSDLNINRGGSTLILRNCVLGSSTPTRLPDSLSGRIQMTETADAYGPDVVCYYQGVVAKETSVVRTGGAGSSAKMTPSDKCSARWPLSLSDDFLSGDFKIWCPAEQQNVTVYIRGFSWLSYPTNSELYVEASYLNNAALFSRATVQSTEVLTDNTTWVGFNVSFTPSRAGWAYITVYLNKYVSGDGVYVDIRPVVS